MNENVTPKTEVSFCQHKICKGASCEHYGRCNHKMYKPDPPEPTTRTCPACGFVNGRGAMNCARCDYPLVI